MVLGEVEEVVTQREIDEETEEEIVKVSSVLSRALRRPDVACLLPQTTRREMEMLFVRGDVIILVSPPLRTA